MVEIKNLEDFVENLDKKLIKDNVLFYETEIVNYFNLLGEILDDQKFFDLSIDFKDNAYAQEKKAFYYHKNNEIEKAIEHCHKAMNITISDNTLFLLGCCYLRKEEDSEKALNIFKELELRHQNDFSIVYNLAICFLKANIIDEALKFLFKAYMMRRNKEVLKIVYIN